MLRHLKISARLTVLVLLGGCLILTAIIGYSYLAARKMIEDELRAKSQHMAEATANRIEIVEKSVEVIVQGLAFNIEDGPYTRDEIFRLLKQTVANNPEVYGACAAMAPYSLGPEFHYSAPYVCRKDSDFNEFDLIDNNYRYDTWPWYTQPRDQGRSVWTEPFYDEGGGNILMITYSSPIFRGGDRSKFVGVATNDVSLDWLTDLLGSLPLGKSGYAFLVTRNGTYISHPDRDLIMKQTIFSHARANEDFNDLTVAEQMVNGQSGFVRTVNHLGEKSWIAFHPISSTGWSLGIVFPEREVMAKVTQLRNEVAFVGIVGFSLLLVIALLIARSITKPIEELDRATRTLATGNLDAPLVEVEGDDEIAHLSQSFARMQRDLKDYIARLQTTTALKERIESEIHIAHSIQMSLVPKTFPPFPDREEFSLYAILDPARDIGGDFYDFFMVDDETICLVVADVSGKGVPAALFMAVTRTFLKALSREEREPARILRRLNDEMVKDNDSNMFVTIFCGMIHLKSGKLRYASGGHNPPFLVRTDGTVSMLPKVKGSVVGPIEDLAFGEGHMQLEPGDLLFLYTDGVTEAMNVRQELYGEERTAEQLHLMRGEDSTAIVKRMREVLRDYAAGAEQSDDITMMAFRFHGHRHGKAKGAPPV